MDGVRDVLKQAEALLRTDGVRALLVYLNGLTSHRFSAMYRFDQDDLTNLHFVDRENPDLGTCEQIPLIASYCVFVRDSGQLFRIDDSIADARVKDHAKRLEIRSYCGVPLLDGNGRMFGTICHFDTDPIPISGLNVAVMESIAPMLTTED